MFKIGVPIHTSAPHFLSAPFWQRVLPGAVHLKWVEGSSVSDEGGEPTSGLAKVRAGQGQGQFPQLLYLPSAGRFSEFLSKKGLPLLCPSWSEDRPAPRAWYPWL